MLRMLSEIGGDAGDDRRLAVIADGLRLATPLPQPTRKAVPT
jgi:hypothetical protein